jgi:hypothetical protein
MLGLSYKDYKIAIISIFKKLKQFKDLNMFKDLKANMKTMIS